MVAKTKSYKPTDKEPFMNERQREYFRVRQSGTLTYDDTAQAAPQFGTGFTDTLRAAFDSSLPFPGSALAVLAVWTVAMLALAARTFRWE